MARSKKSPHSSRGVYTSAQEISRLKTCIERWRVFRSHRARVSLENFSLPLSALRTPVYYAVYNEAILHIDAKSTHPVPSLAVDTHFYSGGLQITIPGAHPALRRRRRWQIINIHYVLTKLSHKLRARGKNGTVDNGRAVAYAPRFVVLP